MGLEHPLLLDRREAGIQRKHLGVGQRQPVDCVGDVVDLAFTRKEHEYITRTGDGQFVDGIDHGLDLVASVARVGFVVCAEGSIAHFDRVGPTGHLDDRRGNRRGSRVIGGRGSEMLSEPLGIDRRRRDDHRQIGTLRQELLEIAEDEIDVEAALVRLVDDQRVVPPQHPVALNLRQQNAVGHHLDQRSRTDLIGEANRVPDVFAERRPEFVGDTLRDGARGDPTGLRVPDQTQHPAPRLQAHLRQLGALARTRLARHDQHLMRPNQVEKFGVALGDRKRVGIVQSTAVENRCCRASAGVDVGARSGRSSARILS